MTASTHCHCVPGFWEEMCFSVLAEVIKGNITQTGCYEGTLKCQTDRRKWVRAAAKKLSPPPSKGRPTKNIYIKSERLSVAE